MNKRKLMLVAIALCMVAVLAAGTTLAYLTDTDNEINVFTVGNVKIDLDENFPENKLMPGKDLTKTAWITNTGSEPAWVWAEVKIPTNLDNGPDTFDASKNILHFNNYGYFTKEYHAGYMQSAIDDGWVTADGAVVTDKLDGLTLVDDVPTYLWTDFEYIRAEDGYNVYVTKLIAPLPADLTSLPFLRKVYVDTHVNVANGDWFWEEKGVKTDIPDDLTNGATILINAFAIQEEGFATVDEAYAAYYEQTAQPSVAK